MRLALTSDLHGSLPRIPSCDLLLIAGDLCPIEDHDLDFQNWWLRDHFVPWLADVPARQKMFIAGNHDFIFAHRADMIEDIDWPGIYLQDSGVHWEGLNFWGSPWASELPGWPFTAPEDELEYCWAMIPRKTDVLLVHGPPRGHGDVVLGRLTGDAIHVGSRTLLRALDRLSQLKLAVFGHIHEAAGFYQHEKTLLVNASHMSVEYEPIQPVQILEL